MNWIALMAVVCIPLSACTFAASDPPSEKEHVLRVSDGHDVPTLNPLYGQDSLLLDSLTAAAFVRFDERGNPEPELITQIPTTQNGGISRDGRSITYHLQRGIRWSDGAPFDATDVLYSVAVINDLSNNIGPRSGWDRVLRTSAPDKYTVVFRLRAPYASFLETFFSNWGQSCLLPKHILGPGTRIDKSDYNGLPIGIGPFRYTAFHRDETVELEANPYYFRGVPKIKKIVYKIIHNDNTLFMSLQTGELDLWSLAQPAFYERLRTLPGKRVRTSLSPYNYGVFFNVQRPVVRDRVVREALRLATDRSEIYTKVYHRIGVMIESLISQVSRDSDPTLALSPYDPRRAERLLDAAGWRRRPDGTRVKGGQPLVIHLAISAEIASSRVFAELLRESWGEIGVRVEPHAYTHQQLWADAEEGGIMFGGRFDAGIAGTVNGPDADITYFASCGSLAPQGYNFMRYCNPTVDRELREYVASYDPRERATLARRFQRQIDNDVPAIIVYERADVAAFDNRLRGFRPKPFGQDDFMNVDFSSRAR